MLFNGSGKEPFGCGNISVFAQQEIDCQAALIDCTIQVSPPSSDSDVRFINTPRCTDRSRIAAPPLRELRDGALDPSRNGCMRDIDTALSHQLYQVAVAQLISDVSSDAENDDGAIKVATMKQRA